MMDEVASRIKGMVKRYKYPGLVLLAGVLILLLPGEKEETILPETEEGEVFSLEEFTRQTEALLSGISGAGEVHLLLTLENGGKNEYLMDRTQSGDGEEYREESKTVLTGSGSDETPVSVTWEYPAFRGAVVVCQGGQSPSVALGIKEAISSLTGLGMDKITVLKMD